MLLQKLYKNPTTDQVYQLIYDKFNGVRVIIFSKPNKLLRTFHHFSSHRNIKLYKNLQSDNYQ